MDADTGAALPLQEGEVEERDNVDGDGAVRFRHDPRLVIASSVYHTKDQVIHVPTVVHYLSQYNFVSLDVLYW